MIFHRIMVQVRANFGTYSPNILRVCINDLRTIHLPKKIFRQTVFTFLQLFFLHTLFAILQRAYKVLHSIKSKAFSEGFYGSIFCRKIQGTFSWQFLHLHNYFQRRFRRGIFNFPFKEFSLYSHHFEKRKKELWLGLCFALTIFDQTICK